MVGKILDKRYVVLEKVGPDGEGYRYLVYDMNSMSRSQIRVNPDEDGELSGKTYTVVSVETPLEPAKGGAAASAPQPAPAETVKPEAASPASKPEAAKPEAAKKPLSSAFQPLRPLSAALKPLESRQPTSKAVTGPAMPSPTIPAPATSGRDHTPATPGPALKPAVAAAVPRQSPLDSTQPIDLETAEEVPAPAPQPAEPRIPRQRKRIQTKVLEAAWFAQGDQLDEEEEDEDVAAAQGKVGQAELERQAEQLSTAEYRKYALELSPPSPPPPLKIVEAFLGTKPDAVIKSVAPEPAPSAPTPAREPSVAALPRQPEPSTPARIASPQPASAREPSVAAARPAPAPSPALSRPAPAPAPQPAPPPATLAGPTPPSALGTLPLAGLVPGLSPSPTLIGVGGSSPNPTLPGVGGGSPSPSPLVPSPTLAAASLPAPPPTEPAAPALMSLPTLPAAPSAFAPPPSPAPVAPLPPGPIAVGPLMSSPTAASAALIRRSFLDRLGRPAIFIIGSVAGLLVGLLLSLAFSSKPPPPPPEKKAVVTCPKVQPPPAPKCPVCPAPAVTPKAGGDSETPPAVPELSAKDKRKVANYVRAARRALKAKQWKKAHYLASQALKTEPGNAAATNIRRTAAGKIR